MAKARKQKLKVFRTPIGFHDAYVAAPSRKAALEAWGAGTDLFSAKIAEEVTDVGAEAAKAALANPGEIVRVARSAVEEEPSPRPTAARGRGGKARSTPAPEKPRPKPKPRPSRTAVQKAEEALARLEGNQAAELAELEKEEVRLANRRRVLEKKQRQALERAQARSDEAQRSYRKAMKEWAE